MAVWPRSEVGEKATNSPINNAVSVYRLNAVLKLENSEVWVRRQEIEGIPYVWYSDGEE